MAVKHSWRAGKYVQSPSAYECAKATSIPHIECKVVTDSERSRIHGCRGDIMALETPHQLSNTCCWVEHMRHL